jgi:hypothetical protein
MFSLNSLKSVIWPFKTEREHFLLGKEEDNSDGRMTIEPHNKVLSDILDENGDEMMISQAGEGPSEQALQGMSYVSN